MRLVMAYVTAYEDLPYGALYVEDHGDYADVAEVTDLDSATGTTDLVLIDQGSAGIDYGYRTSDSTLANERGNFHSAMSAAGPGGHQFYKITGQSREDARLTAYEALWNYGARDIESSLVVATSPEWSANGESWTPDIVLESVDQLSEVLYDQYGIESREWHEPEQEVS